MLELTTNNSGKTSPEISQTLDELAREGARRMIAAALEAEVEDYLQRHCHERDEHGHAMVVRNGKAKERTVTMGAGAVKLRAPRVNDRRQDHHFSSKILPSYMRRSPRLEEALPVLYLRGLSTGDFQEALPVLLGPEAAGLSASTITRLIRTWQDEYKGWQGVCVHLGGRRAFQRSPGGRQAGLPCDCGRNHRWKQGSCRSGRWSASQKRHGSAC